jgi:ribosomal protein L20A (L18A)
MKNGREEKSEGMMKQQNQRRKGRGGEEWEITHRSMASQHSLTRSRIHIPHTNSLVIGS